MARWQRQVERIKSFLLRDMWEIDTSDISRFRQMLLRPTRVATLATHGFISDRCLLRASALTYSTLLSIVPLLALMVSVLKGFGVQNALEPIILDRLALGTEEIVTQIIGYINNTNMARLGALGLATLMLAVLALLSNIEKSFNHIWGVSETRPLMRRFADYFSVVTIGPIFIIAAISMTSTLQSTALINRLEGMSYVGQVVIFLFSTLPYVSMWITFTALYIFMPNCKVNYRAALVGGVFGGTLWQLAQWGYVHFQVGVGRYNAIYGTMAALPIFMVWLYLSWLIVLLGLEVTYAWQNQRTALSDIRGEEVSFSSRELVALTILLVISEAFYRGEKSWDSEKICSELDLPPRLGKSILDQLVELGYLSEVRDGEDQKFAYQPGRAPETLTVHGVIQGLKSDGLSCSRLRRSAESEVIGELEQKIEAAGRQTLGELTLRDLVLQMAEKKTGGEQLGPVP